MAVIGILYKLVLNKVKETLFVFFFWCVGLTEMKVESGRYTILKYTTHCRTQLAIIQVKCNIYEYS